MFQQRFGLSGQRISASIGLLVITMVCAFNLIGCGGHAKVSVAVTASATTVDGTDSTTLSATVTNDRNSAGVTWTVSGGGTLSNTSTTGATFTAPAATNSAQTATVTATSVADTTKTASATITVPAAPAVTTGALAAGAVGTAYTQTLTATGGIPPYTWTLASGTLPTCLTITQSASGASIGGTPTASCAGSFTLTFKVTDSGTATALTATSPALTLTIAAAPAIALPTPSTLAAATYNVSYAGSVAATGGAGALTYSITAGALPKGLSLNPNTGAITGTPTVTGTASFTITAMDGYGDSNNQAYSITVSYPQMVVTSATLPTGYDGSNYPQTTLMATGGTGVAANYTWALSGGSNPPAGISLSAAGVITGKPTGTPGTTSFSVTATDTVASLTSTPQQFSIVVKPAVSFTTATTLPTAYTNSAYSQTVQATGGSGSGYTYAVTSGQSSLTAVNLSLSAAGVLSGTPTATGAPSFTVTATDSVGNTASATFSLTVSPGVSVTTPATLPAGYQGAAYTAVTLAATGGTGAPYTWTVTVGASGLSAAGMSLSSAGVLSGTPTTSGAINFTAQATDSSGLNVGSLAFSLNVVAKLAITTAALPGGTLNVAYSQTLLATGGTGPYTWSTDSTGTSSLAAVGLTLSGAGLVSGATPSLGTASFTATVTDSASHTAALPFTIAITNALTISTSSLPAAYTGTAYSQTLSAAGGSGSGYTFSVAGTSNLATFNLSLSSAGLISGTPATTGTASFTAKVTDSANNTYQAPFTIQVYNPVTLPAPNPTTLGPATVSSPYSGTIVAAGGSGTGYTWTVTGLPSDGLTSSSSGATLTISGTPTSATTVTFGASVQDSLGNMAGPFTYSIVASNPAPLTLPTPNPTSLGSATANQIYSGSISLSGGASPYIWSINGTPVPTNGTALPLSDGLSATNTGGSTLSISGTPTTTGTVTLTSVTVKDNANTTAGPDTYTIAVNSASSQVSGQIYLLNSCGTIAALPQMTVQINTSPVQQTTTDNNGNYSFASVPNGTYTITPSITGASSVFYPATLTGVVVDNANVSGQTFNVALGYSVSGNVTYAGTNTGQVYLNLVNTSCGGSGGEGTSISKATLGSGGAFTVNGVAPGSYTLEAWTDPATLAEGAQNITDPTGTASVSVTSANVTGTAVTLADPTLSAPTNLPKLKSIEPANLGVIISFGGGSVSNNSGIEVFTSYTVEASTTSSFTSPITATYKAIGPKSNVWIVGNGVTGITGGTFSNGTAYYFRVMGTSPAGNSSWAYWAGPGVACITSSCAVTATVGAPTTGNAVTGIVVIPSGITPTGPLYVGLYDQTNNIAYGQYIASPATGAAGNSFTVYVPSGTDYFEFGILDQNKNGLIDAGDVSNTQNNSSNVSVSGATDLPTITLPNANSAVITQTQFNQSTFWNGSSSQTSSNYNLNFQVREQDNLPVAVQLTAASNPNVITPVDVSNYCPGCGALQFQYYQGINGDVPQDNDTYTFHVTYSNGTSENITGTVTSVLGTSALATNLAPQENNSTTTTPTFTWTFPSSPGSYTYQFDISGSSGGTLWQVPSNNSNSNGFTNTQIPGTLTWGTDPTDGTNTPTVGSLTSGTIYTWQIVSMDSNGNAAQNSVWYQP